MQVYAWMPVLGFEIPGRPLVEATRPGTKGSTYDRLTPFDAENRRIIGEIYEDLARHSVISGILYHDDAVLGDYEDASPAAAAWREEIGLPAGIDAIHADPDMMNSFSKMKTKFLIDFTNELTAAIRSWSPPVKTARNLYAQVAINPDSETWFAQNYDDFLCNYDYVGLMAMPYMEGERHDPDGWLKRLAKIAAGHPLGRQKTVFELQAVDWKTQSPVPSPTLARQMLLLQRNGIGNLGYYPEDPIKDHPDINTIYPSFSLVGNKYMRHKLPQHAESEFSTESAKETAKQQPSWYVGRERPQMQKPYIAPDPRR
jgi:biofilm PGA synthesis lipoprotein PgaB